jgi:uncharacterized DUF497 family protein
MLMCIYNNVGMPRAATFDWDGANTAHIARHGVTPAEVEQAFANDSLVVLTVQKRSGEERVLCGPHR